MMDLIVNLYDDVTPFEIKHPSVRIIKPLSPMNHLVLEYIKTAFSPFWARVRQVLL